MFSMRRRETKTKEVVEVVGKVDVVGKVEVVISVMDMGRLSEEDMKEVVKAEEIVYFVEVF